MSAARPRVWLNLFYSELAFQAQQNIPFMLGQIDNFDSDHFRRLIAFASGLDRFPTHVSDSKSKNSFGWHDPEPFRTYFFREDFAMPFQ